MAQLSSHNSKPYHGEGASIEISYRKAAQENCEQRDGYNTHLSLPGETKVTQKRREPPIGLGQERVRLQLGRESQEIVY